MSQREPSDDEIDAAFGEIIGNFRVLSEDSGIATAGMGRVNPPPPTKPSSTPAKSPAEPSSVAAETDADDDAVLRGRVVDLDPPDDDDWDQITEDEPIVLPTTWRSYELAEEPEDDEPVLVRRLPPWRPSVVAIIAMILLALGVWLGLGAFLPIWHPPYSGWFGLTAVLIASGLLISRLPRYRSDDDHGAQV